MAAKNYPPNLMSRREQTRKKEQCQLCRKPTPLKDQFTVENDLENLTVKKRKNAAAKASAKKSHYCSDCAEKRVTQKAAWMRATYGEANGVKAEKGTGRKAQKTAAKSKAQNKAKKSAAKKNGSGKASTAKKAAKSASKPKGPKARKAAKAAATTSSTEEDPF